MSIDINYNPNDPVININKNPYRFTFKYDSLTSDKSTVHHIDLPICLHPYSLFQGYVNFSKTQRFNKLHSGSQYHYAISLRFLIEFFSEDDNHHYLLNEDDRAISVHYLNYLSTVKNLSQDSIFRHITSIASVLTYCSDRSRSDFNPDTYDSFLDDLSTQMPNLSRPESNPNSTFTNSFDVKYSDDEILISMRHVLNWFMETMQDIRHSFLNENRELAKSIFNVFDNGKITYQNRVMKMSPDPTLTNNEVYGNNGLYLDALLKLKNPILNEMLLLSSRNIGRQVSSGERFTVWQVRRELQRQFPSKKNRKHQPKNLKINKTLLSRYDSLIIGKKQNAPLQSVFPIGCMFTSTLAERRAISWLWASERIQASGHDGAMIEDMLFDKYDKHGTPTELQIKFPKPRAGRYFKTPIYKKGEDALFDVYYNNYLLRKDEEKYFSKVERPGYLAASKWNKLFQRQASLCQSSHLPLLLLGMPGTTMYNLCVAEVEKSKPFLKVLTQSVESSTQYRDMRSKRKYYGEDNKITTYPKAISMAMISQARAIMEDEDSDDMHVTAESSSHSVGTHADTYLAKSDLTKKMDCSHSTFGSDVGDKMYDLCNKMGKIVKHEHGWDAGRIIAQLGLNAEAHTNLEGAIELNEVLEVSRSSGLATSLVDGLGNLSSTFIVQDPTIVAIIISFHDHLSRLKVKLEKEGESVKVKVLISHQIYLKSLLERFHGKHLKKGREIAKSLILPYRRSL